MMKFIFAVLITSFSISANAEDCIRLVKDTRAKVQPSKAWVNFKADDTFRIIKKSADGKLVFAIKKDDKAIFKMTDVIEELCLHSTSAEPDNLTIDTPVIANSEKPAVQQIPKSSPTKNEVAATDQQTESFWRRLRFGVEYQQYSNTTSSPYQNLVTKIPDPSDVSPLQDPLIMDIARGAGSMLRLTTEIPYSEKVDLRAHIGSRKLTYKYVQKSNPGVTTVALDSLPSTERSFDVTHFGFGFGGKYYFSSLHNNQIRFFLGGEAELLYSTKSEITINVLTGNLFKNTPSSVTVKIDQISADGQLNLGINYNQIYLSLGMTPNMSYVISLGGWIGF